MSVFATIQQDMVAALKQKATLEVSTLRGLKAAIQKAAIDSKSPIDDDQRAFIVLKQEAKKREDSVTAYAAAGRTDLADQESAELAVIKKYLPEQLSEAEVKAALQPIVAAATDKNFGGLMKQAMQAVQGKADGKVVSTVLKQLLAVVCVFLFATPALAQVNTSFDFILGDASPVDIIIAIINWTLGILALLATIIILYGGFTWMLAQGDEAKIEKAKLILRNAVIGLVIILASWGIARYIINLLLDVTGTNNNEYATPYDPYEPGSGSPFYVDHTNPADEETDVPLCHIIAVTFSYPVNEASVTASSFMTTIPADTATNPDGGKGNGESCTDDVQCLSGVCSDGGSCDGDQVAGSFAFSESDYAAVFYPSADYLSNTTYRIELDTTIEGINPETGAVYNLTSGDAKRIFTFTTGTTTDDIPPKVDVADVTPYPTDEEIDICLNPTLQATFSESLDPASPSDENVWLYSYDGSEPSDALDLGSVRLTSIGGEADDTIVTSPQDQLSTYTEYGLSLYSGDSSTDTFAGAIYDTCGNPLSGDFDDNMEGSTTDDFVDATSAGLSQAFCSCTTGTDTCNVAVGDSSCTVDATTTCTLDATCSDTHDDYIGFDYQWTFTTGDEPYCLPDIDNITQEDYYYSEDEAPTGSTGSEDTGVVLIEGSYLYPFYDVDFNDNVSAAGMGCFDTDFSATMSCFVSNTSSTAITLRTPVGSRTGHIVVENGDGSDTSGETAIIDSPYIRNTSPVSGPTGQYVTIRGVNFGNDLGQVFFDDIEAEVQCADGWDDDQIIVAVPEGFTSTDTPLIQVITADSYYSNDEGFTITDGAPGPGICELEPSCSDTGADNVTAVGENFGDSGTVYFDPSAGEYVEGDVSSWNVFDATYNSYTIVTDGTPVTEPDTYNFTAGNSSGISNGLDFDITCSEPPQLFSYYQCDLDDDTYYLSNPTAYSDNACVNSVIYYAFTNGMADSTVEDNTHIYRCGNGATFDSTECTTEITGTFVSDYLHAGYIGGDSTETLDGSSDINEDGTADEQDAYSAYTFYPDDSLSAGYYYQVTLSTDITNSVGVALDDDYSWYFQVRDDSSNCVADYLALNPATERVNTYDSFDACIDNYTYSDTSYSLRARLATSDCLVLDDAGNYTWSVDDGDILKFGDNDADSGDDPGSSASDTSTIGYNTVCVQGEDEENDGTATVTANLLDPSDSSVAATDTALVEVDYGFCTQDSDCYTADCRDTYCDPITSHCAPDITGFNPNNATGSDVGPGGCVTLNGCYFGNDQDQAGYCTCTNLEVDTSVEAETCTVEEGSSTCLLTDGVHTCSLGEQYCELGETCTTASSSANFDLDFFQGCDCSVTMSDSSIQTCRVAEGDDKCVVSGIETCDASDSTFSDGGAGTVTFDSTEASYPSETICGDTWDNDQVIAQVPNDGSVTAGDYNLTLSSYYSLTDTYDESTCTVGSDATPCLCRADPDTGREDTTTDLYGEGFDILTADGGEEVTFAGSTSRLATDGSEIWSSANFIDDAIVPDGAVTDDDGVQLDSTSYTSNALEFSVSCGSDYDCSTGCCSAGQCAAAEVCNACEGDSDCTYGSCLSTCVDGVCAPYIVELSPTSGAVGQPTTIQGCHFGTYYDPTLYSPGSQVTVDGITADLACDTTDSWTNLQVIATMPDGIFSDTTTDSADVVVQQVYTSGGSQVAQGSNTVTFTRDESCSEVDLPVLCDADPAYSPVTTTYDIDLDGENFRNQNDGYCTCATDTLGDCDIAEGDTSCTVSATTTYYVNPAFTSETCATTTSNGYTVYDSINGYCVYTDPSDTSVSCTIAVGSSSCAITDTETCYADATDATIACTSAVSSFTNLDGSAEYEDNIEANVDWSQYTSSQYLTDVPTGSETGDVIAIATTAAGTQCASNGLEFPVTCSSCSDCTGAEGTLLNCNLDYDPSFGSCTTDTTGFCRAEPDSCCNLSSCVYDDSASETEDTGACETQPILEFDDEDGDGLTDGIESALGYDDSLQDTDDDGTVDSDEAGFFNGNFGQVGITSVTFPTPDATAVCPNGQMQIQFSRPITTSDAFPFNDNDPLLDEDGNDITDFTDDVAAADIDFTDYVRLHLAAQADLGGANDVSDVSISNDGTTLTLELDQILAFGRDYEIVIESTDAVQTGTNAHLGIVDAESGVAVGCTTEMANYGLCYDDTSDYVRYEFTTITSADYADACGPSYVTLEADDEDFIDANYTFSESEQEEDFTATVYAAGEDVTPATDDDQPITRIDDGTDEGFDWTYDWDPVYDSLEDLEAATCPVAGIITEDEVGSCECTVSESCTITLGDEACTTSSGVLCYTDSPNATCDSFDSNYSSAGCECTVTDSCTMTAEETSCTVEVNDTEVSCAPDSGSCTEADSAWEAGDFSEDEATQTMTADTPDDNGSNSDTLTVTVTGDGSVEQGWGNTSATIDDLVDSLVYDFYYCDADYLASYSNSDYNFYWAYCRGTDPQEEDFLPEFEEVFSRSDSDIDTAYGSDQEFIYEVVFKDTRASTNDATTNNNIIAVRVYPNDLDDDLTTPGDAINPELWYLLNTNTTGDSASETTINGYDAVTVGNTTYVAATNLPDGSGTLSPYIFVVAYSNDAESATTAAATAMLDGFKFNRNTAFADECALQQSYVIEDTDRITDLGTLSYLLSSYYYNDTDANGSDDFPALASGSYISGLTTSIWPSWNDGLGAVLGQTLPTDPTNAFADASAACPYDPPDLSLGETTGTYYDESGTCWDPVLNDFFGPDESHAYLYQYRDADDFALYTNLEYTGTGSWIDGAYDPCASYDDGTAVDASVSDYSDAGCATFDYVVEDSETTDNTTYADIF